MKKCYMCDEPGSTKEHVPPRYFFPPGYRTQLATVPSCPVHNNANSLDVEYVCNVIALHFKNNPVGVNHALDKVLRSFQKSVSLAKRTFKDYYALTVDGIDA